MRRISDLPDDEARAELRACCGSVRWVDRMLCQRPFRDRADVFDSAERIWWDLAPVDWLEAFAAHPKIGARVAGNEAQEQAGAVSAPDAVKAELASANEEYERRFGFIYIVCASGKSAAEMLEICRTRLENVPNLEIRVAAAEQAMITKLRLEKLLALGE